MLPAMRAILRRKLRDATALSGVAAILLGLVAAGEAAALSARETDYQDWRVRCETPDGGGAEHCLMGQGVRTEDGRANLMHIVVSYPPDESQGIAPVAQISVPLGVYLPNGLALSIDGGQVLRLPFEYCSGQGCKTRIKLEGDILQALKQGGMARFEFLQFLNAKQFVADVSLKGFTAALDALK